MKTEQGWALVTQEAKPLRYVAENAKAEAALQLGRAFGIHIVTLVQPVHAVFCSANVSSLQVSVRRLGVVGTRP